MLCVQHDRLLNDLRVAVYQAQQAQQLLGAGGGTAAWAGPGQWERVAERVIPVPRDKEGGVAAAVVVSGGACPGLGRVWEGQDGEGHLV